MEQNKNKTGYPIGVVARLTGIQPTTLRIWERRYGLVEPVRSEGRNRSYSDADIERLSLVKTLVDAGHQISTVANMTMNQLQARLEATSVQALKRPSGESRPCRVVVLGSALPERIRDKKAHASELDLAGSFADEDELVLRSAALAPEVLILELATIHKDALGKVRRLLSASGARQAVVIYGFGSRQALKDLGAAGVVCLRAPADLSEVASACRNAVRATLVSALAAGEPVTMKAIPPRQFRPEQLAHFANLVPKITCECPHHLVDLINSLSAFETYSQECQNRNPEDAEIHTYLHQVAGHSRAMFERALQRVVEFEGIPLT
jgi:MerR family transcriptional regulator, light-induced transcriptional regulator